ncbi:MAG: MmgE/PrpD family protein [Vicinamibacterales bacterium]
MNVDSGAAAALGAFAVDAGVPDDARRNARAAWLDTIGVIVAGSVEPPARIVQRVCAAEGEGRCRVLGTPMVAATAGAALANGTAGHALDYDDMCFVSMAHPSAPLVAAGLAAGELVGSSGRELLEAYVVGFEIECVLGRAMNPSHYARGWHCTSTLGSVGAAAAVSRLLRLERSRAAHALSIAASEASGLKENFGSMVKPLHAGLSARNGVLAALLAADGFTASGAAIDGAQGFVAVFSNGSRDLAASLVGLGSRWEILESGVTVKLYPSCAATHPTIDALLDLRRRHGFTGEDVEAIEVTVDAVTPTVLIYPEPRTGLEAKFSMPFCAAAAAALGEVGIGTFDAEHVADPIVRRLASRVTVRVDEELGRHAPPLTQAHVAMRLSDGRRLTARADGARGYPARPASRADLNAKFRACASRALQGVDIEYALEALHRFEELPDIRLLTGRMAGQREPSAPDTTALNAG